MPDPAGWEERSWVSACVSGVDGELVAGTAVETCDGVRGCGVSAGVGGACVIDSSNATQKKEKMITIYFL